MQFSPRSSVLRTSETLIARLGREAKEIRLMKLQFQTALLEPFEILRRSNKHKL